MYQEQPPCNPQKKQPKTQPEEQGDLAVKAGAQGTKQKWTTEIIAEAAAHKKPFIKALNLNSWSQGTTQHLCILPKPNVSPPFSPLQTEPIYLLFAFRHFHFTLLGPVRSEAAQDVTSKYLCIAFISLTASKGQKAFVTARLLKLAQFLEAYFTISSSPAIFPLPLPPRRLHPR